MKRKLLSTYRTIRDKDLREVQMELEESQWIDRDSLALLQKDKLLKLIDQSVVHTPFYNDKYSFCREDLSKLSIEDILSKFNPLRKKEVISNYFDFKNPSYSGEVLLNYSGGSTGEPVRVNQSTQMQIYNRAATQRSDGWAGWSEESFVFKFWGASRDKSPTYKEVMKRIVFNEYVYDAFDFDHNTVPRIHHSIERKKPDIIISYASALHKYVQVAKDNLLVSTHTPRGIITSADQLYDFQRLEIEDYFQTQIFNRYGCREVGLIASECEYHCGLHVSSERLIVEVVNIEGDAVEEGEVGRILITDLTNYAFPLVRYEIGDLGIMDKSSICKCGRVFPKIKSLQGRVTEYIIDTRGHFINGAALSTLVPRFENIKQMQLVQTRIGEVRAKVIITNTFTSEDSENVVSTLKKFLGKDMSIIIEPSQRLLNNKSGKYSFVINNIE